MSVADPPTDRTLVFFVFRCFGMHADTGAAPLRRQATAWAQHNYKQGSNAIHPAQLVSPGGHLGNRAGNRGPRDEPFAPILDMANLEFGSDGQFPASLHDAQRLQPQTLAARPPKRWCPDPDRATCQDMISHESAHSHMSIKPPRLTWESTGPLSLARPSTH